MVRIGFSQQESPPAWSQEAYPCPGWGEEQGKKDTPILSWPGEVLYPILCCPGWRGVPLSCPGWGGGIPSCPGEGYTHSQAESGTEFRTGPVTGQGCIPSRKDMGPETREGTWNQRPWGYPLERTWDRRPGMKPGTRGHGVPPPLTDTHVWKYNLLSYYVRENVCRRFGGSLSILIPWRYKARKVMVQCCSANKSYH